MIRKSLTLSLQEKIEQRRQAGKKVYSLSNPTFNSKNLNKISLRSYNLQGKLTGEQKLKKIAQDYLFNDWTINNKSKNKILITSGAKAALYCIFKGLVDINKKNICVINPNWPTYFDIIQLANGIPHHFNTYLKDNFELDLEKLENKIIKSNINILVLTSPNNPTGKIIDNLTINKLIRICSKLKCYLVIDESFSSYVFQEQKLLANKNFDNKYTILVNSFSKNFHLQGLRLGAILCSDNLYEIFSNIHIAINGAANFISQKLIIDNKKNLLKKININSKLKLVTNFFDSKNVNYYKPDGSFYIFPKINNKKYFKKVCERNGLFYLNGKAFGKIYNDYYRFCFEKKISELKLILNIMAKYDIY